MDAVAGDVGVGGQGDFGVDGVGVGVVLADGAHTLEGRIVVQAGGGQLVIEAVGVDGLGQKWGCGGRDARLLSAQRAAGMQDPGTVVVVIAGSAVHRHGSSVGVIDGVHSDLQIGGIVVGQNQGGVQDQLIDDGAVGVLAGVQDEFDESGCGQDHGVVDTVSGQPGVRADR
ncbi:hypothetical protein MSIMFI_05379 [Mycobacterium simulans]|nr:hypothetical protein MSIMFI_05379 [Mycobacterium simulans]